MDLWHCFMYCQTLHAGNRSVLKITLGFFFFSASADWKGFFYLCILAGPLFIFDTLCFVPSRFACFGCDFLKCALILRADFACEKYLALHSPQQVLCCCCFFNNLVKLDSNFGETQGNISDSCQCQSLICGFCTEHPCAKTPPIFLIQKNSHAQS